MLLDESNKLDIAYKVYFLDLIFFGAFFAFGSEISLLFFVFDSEAS